MAHSNMQFRKALITGASSGIGEALAHLLADEGIDLILAGRDVERLEAVRRAVSDRVSAQCVVGDLIDSEDRARMVQCLQSELPDLVINNAGLGLYGEALSYSFPTLQKLVDLNVSAMMEVAVEAARALVTAGKTGVILNVSSAAAFQVFPSLCVYSATKAFVNQFSESLDAETRHQGVRVLVSCPGVVDTRFQERALGDSNVLHKAHIAMTPEKAAKAMWKQICHQKAFNAFGRRYKVLCFLSRHLSPRWFTMAFLRFFFLRKLPDRELVCSPDVSLNKSTQLEN